MAMRIVVCTDLWGKELHSQVGGGIVVISESLCGAMVAHWPGMSEIWVKFLLQAYFPFSSLTHDTGWCDHGHVQAMHRMVV